MGTFVIFSKVNLEIFGVCPWYSTSYVVVILNTFAIPGVSSPCTNCKVVYSRWLDKCYSENWQSTLKSQDILTKGALTKTRFFGIEHFCHIDILYE